MRKFFLIIILFGCILMTPWAIISWQTRDLVYRDIDTIPARETGLLLGTSPSVGGQENLFFSTRIEAAKELYERGKIKKIIVSGDNSTPAYNEPKYMKNALLERGVPEEDIIIDSAGIRTLDSVVRARDVFDATGFTIISQPFHIERALYLAKANGIDAIGYGAANVSIKYGPFAYLREIPARWLALFDAWFEVPPSSLEETKTLQ